MFLSWFQLFWNQDTGNYVQQQGQNEKQNTLLCGTVTVYKEWEVDEVMQFLVVSLFDTFL